MVVVAIAMVMMAVVAIAMVTMAVVAITMVTMAVVAIAMVMGWKPIWTTGVPMYGTIGIDVGWCKTAAG